MNPSTEYPRSLKTVSEYRKERREKIRMTGELNTDIFATLNNEALLNDKDSRSIKAALDLFDTESQIASPNTFLPDAQLQRNDSALAEFMSKAAGIESVFEFDDKNAASDTVLGEQLSRVAGLADFSPALEPANTVPLVQTSPENLSTSDMKKELRTSRTMSVFDQAAVLRDPQELSGAFTATIERDQKGRVVKALYIGGEFCRFQYGDNDDLSEIYYAGLSWKKDADGWFARDRQTDYRVDGKITVLEDGCIRIEKDDVVRTLKHSGTRIDEHRSGSRTESRKLKNLPSPYDLLAKAKPVNSLWLNSGSKKTSTGERLVLNSPMSMEVINQLPAPEFPSLGSSMIPPIADVAPLMDTGNFQAVSMTPSERSDRPDKLRELEDQLAVSEQRNSTSTLGSIKEDLVESYLKSCLWVMDRLKGQSSPTHLRFLDRLACLYFDRQRFELSELTHLRALHIREKCYGSKQPELSINMFGLAQIYECRNNLLRAEDLYRESIDLQELGLRKTLFLFSERVIDAGKFSGMVEPLFYKFSELVRFLVTQRKMKEAASLQERAVKIYTEISERESEALRAILSSVVEPHLLTIKELISTKSAGTY